MAAEVDVLPVSDEERARQEERRFERDLVETMPPAYAMVALVLLNAGTFALQLLRAGNGSGPDLATLVWLGANYGPLTLDGGELWRLVAAMFLHAGWVHIVLNMLALWSSGHIVERLYGPASFLVLYFASGIAASLGSVYAHPLVPSVGASGAIMGVYGCLLAFHLQPNPVLSAAARKVELKSLAMFFAANLLVAIQHREIDMAAHVVGAVTGFGIGCIYSFVLQPRLPHLDAVAAIAPPGQRHLSRRRRRLLREREEARNA